ncbi:MAG: putative structural protein [Prokaryotic dsDNA virus sp.]|nr:MAG: putative structural protein [Prokaryotic dsDNA virus sp.]|tara:strand:- start:24241 stop:25230 length:990 start_codon:yes stop_codon:yes gene_type:complete
MAFDANYTLTHSESATGWPSYYTYYPDWIKGMNNYLYTWKGGDLYRHNTNNTRNNYYGTQDWSIVTSVVNDEVLENKIFKTIAFQSNQAWFVLSAATDTMGGGTGTPSQTTVSASINPDWFELKEGVWYAYLRYNNASASSMDQDIRTTQGIINVLFLPGAGLPNNWDTTIPTGVIIALARPTLSGRGNQAEGYVSYVQAPPVYGNVSVGDSIFVKSSIGGVEYFIGTVTALHNKVNPVDIEGGSAVFSQNQPEFYNFCDAIVVDNTVLGATAVPATSQAMSGDLYYAKNNQANSTGLVGHYLEFTILDFSSSPSELFAVQSDVMKSYP